MQTLIAANWKMHKTRNEARNIVHQLADGLSTSPGLCEAMEIVLFPPFTALDAADKALKDYGLPVAIGGQNIYPARSGAFTGEISPDMLLDAGCTWTLTGHSERRHLMGESSVLTGKKTACALECGLSVILCVGETLTERETGQLQEVLHCQLADGLSDVSPENFSRLVVAYEPVWAIGTGKVASGDDIFDAHGFVRQELKALHGTAGQAIRILYGGSVKPDNAADILGIDNVNGLLVGGASLQAESFLKIIRAGQKD